MNKSDHQAFRLFSQTHSPAITAVFVELYHWGTITWAGHKAGDWFYKSAKQIAEDLGIALKTAKRAFEIIRKGLCPVFKSEVRKKGNFPITWFKVIKKEQELSTKYQGQKDPSVNFYEDQNDPTPGSKRPQYQGQKDPGINITTHNKNSMSIRDARETPEVDQQQTVEVSKRQTGDNFKMVEIWNSLIRPSRPETITTRREQQCFEVLRDHFNDDLDQWREHCVRITKSRYLMGDNFFLHLNWALKPQWIQKVQEAGYDNFEDENAVPSQPAIQLPPITRDEALSDCTSEVDRKVKEVLFYKMDANAYASWIKRPGTVFEMKGDRICITSCGDYTRKRIEQDFETQLEQAYATVCASLSDFKSSLIDHREGVDVNLLIYGNKPLTSSGDVLWAK